MTAPSPSHGPDEVAAGLKMLTAGLADRMGIHWKLRPATVHSPSAADIGSIRVPVVMDADNTVMHAVSMIGALAAGSRVYVIRIPPAGNFIVGYLGTALSRPGDLMATPVTTSSNGTITSGTTDTIDAVLGPATFIALPGVRYKTTFVGRAGSMSVATDRFFLSYHYTTDGTSPTNADPTFGAGLRYVLGQAATIGAGVCYIGTFIPVPAGGGLSAEVNVSTSWQRSLGTGTLTPTGDCELFVEAMGLI